VTRPHRSGDVHRCSLCVERRCDCVAFSVLLLMLPATVVTTLRGHTSPVSVRDLASLSVAVATHKVLTAVLVRSYVQWFDWLPTSSSCGILSLAQHSQTVIRWSLQQSTLDAMKAAPTGNNSHCSVCTDCVV
jgi:hypothetical protein